MFDLKLVYYLLKYQVMWLGFYIYMYIYIERERERAVTTKDIEMDESFPIIINGQIVKALCLFLG